jgi:hypothetical protein
MTLAYITLLFLQLTAIIRVTSYKITSFFNPAHRASSRSSIEVSGSSAYPSRYSMHVQASKSSSSHFTSRELKVQQLRALLSQEQLTVMPCCYDGLSARLVEHAGFNLTFMTGFGVSAVHGFPDTGLISVHEMALSATVIGRSLKHIPCIGDGDTVSFRLVDLEASLLMVLVYAG